MESRFGHDFTNVRIHTDGLAGRSAAAIHSAAYAFGEHVVFGDGRFAPRTSAGQDLLAHELAHVLQQRLATTEDAHLRVAGPGDTLEINAQSVARSAQAPDSRSLDIKPARHSIQRQPSDAAPTTLGQQELDRLNAMFISVFNSGLESTSPDLLLGQAGLLAQRYRDVAPDENKVRTRLALAAVLTRLHETLLAHEQSAERDVDGALLTRRFADMAPWSDQRPHQVSDIELFSSENVLAWRTDAVLHEQRDLAEAGPRPRVAPARVDPPPILPASETTDPHGGPPASVALQEQQQTSQERSAATDPGGGSEIRRGLDGLRGRTLGNLGAAAVGSPAASNTALSTCSQVWYISNRLYQIDRTGHIIPGNESWLDVSSLIGFEKGGAYLIVPVEERVAGTRIQFRAFSMNPSQQGPLVMAQIGFPRVITALAPALELRRRAQEQASGIGLIVSNRFGERQTIHDLSFGNVERAVRRVPALIPWAVRTEIARLREDPLGELASQAMGYASSYALRLLPPVGSALLLYQLTRLVQWLGEVGNIAAYARTDDEIELAAQAIAQKLVGFVTVELISRGIGRGVRLGTRAAGAITRRVGAPPPAPPAASQRGTTAEPQADRPSAPRALSPVEPAASPPAPQGMAGGAAPRRAPSPDPPAPRAGSAATPPAAPRQASPAEAAPTSPPQQAAPAASAPARPTAPDVAPPRTATPGSASSVARPPSAPTPPQRRAHAIDDLLSADRTRFNTGNQSLRSRLTSDQAAALDRLQAAYDRYRARNGADAAPPETWARRLTRDRPREDAENLFGADYARTGRGSGRTVPQVRLADVPRPADYSDVRLNSDLAALRGQPSLWDRLTALRNRGLSGDGVDPGLFSILKGNIGEILARPAVNARLAQRRAMPATADARAEFGVRVARVRPDGTHSAPVLFSDGLIVTDRGGRLRIHDTVEVKAGSRGGSEATSQFFEWREGRLAEGDQIVLANGQRFTYRPGRPGPGFVEGLQSSIPQIISSRGSGALGTASAEQVAVGAQRTELSTTTSEIEYLARVLLGGLAAPAPPSPGAVAR